MTDPLIKILDRHPEYTRLRDAMVNGEGPAGVFGLGESHKGHIAAALSTGRAVLLVAPNEVAAVKLHDDIACYDIPAPTSRPGRYPCPARALPPVTA